MSSSGDRDPALLGVASAAVGLGNPAAGADWSNAPGAGKTLVAVRARLTTAVAVANRSPQLQVTDGAGHVLVMSPPAPAQAASLVTDYVWSAVPFASGANGAVVMMPMVFPTLAAAWTVGTVTAGIQAADQWSLIFLTVAG